MIENLPPTQLRLRACLSVLLESVMCSDKNCYLLRITRQILKLIMFVVSPEVSDNLTNRFVEALNKDSFQTVFRKIGIHLFSLDHNAWANSDG